MQFQIDSAISGLVVLLADLDEQITQAQDELAEMVPASPFRTLTSAPGWGGCGRLLMVRRR